MATVTGETVNESVVLFFDNLAALKSLRRGIDNLVGFGSVQAEVQRLQDLFDQIRLAPVTAPDGMVIVVEAKYASSFSVEVSKRQDEWLRAGNAHAYKGLTHRPEAEFPYFEGAYAEVIDGAACVYNIDRNVRVRINDIDSANPHLAPAIVDHATPAA